MDKKSARLRRARRPREKMKTLNMHRLCVHRTPRHIYAQVIAPTAEVITMVSSMDRDLRKDLANTGNVEAATAVGRAIAERSQSKGIQRVAFDRAGFKYHGRIKALAEAAREAGLAF